MAESSFSTPAGTGSTAQMVANQMQALFNAGQITADTNARFQYGGVHNPREVVGYMPGGTPYYRYSDQGTYIPGMGVTTAKLGTATPYNIAGLGGRTAGADYQTALMGSKNAPSTIRGGSTYGDYIPTTAKAGDIVQFGDKLSIDSPLIQSLIGSGMAAPFADKSVIFTRNYSGQQAQTNPLAGYESRFQNPQQVMTAPGANMALNATNPLATAGPNAQPAVPYNYTVGQLPEQQRQALDTQLRHQLELSIGQKNVPKDLSSFVNAMAFGGYTAQDVANHLSETAKFGTSSIVNPSVQRWHWIVGGKYGEQPASNLAAGMGGGAEAGAPATTATGMGAGFGGINEFMAGLDTPPMEEIGPYGGFDFTPLMQSQERMADAIARQSQEAYNNQIERLSRDAESKSQAAALANDQLAAKNYATLARLGAMGNSTAAEGFMNGLAAQKQADLQKIDAEKNDAMQQATDAYNQGNLQLAEKTFEAYKTIAFNQAKDLHDVWESKKDVRQLGVNEWQVKTNFLLGALGKAIDLQELGLDQQKINMAAQEMQLDQQKFEELKRQNGAEEAMKWAQITGYYVGKDGNLTPTLDLLKSKVSGGGGDGTGGGTGTGGAMYDAYIAQDDQGNLVPNIELLKMVPGKQATGLIEGVYNRIAERTATQSAGGELTGQEGTTSITPPSGGWTRYLAESNRQLPGESPEQFRLRSIKAGQEYGTWKQRRPGEQEWEYQQRTKTGREVNILDRASNWLSGL